MTLLTPDTQPQPLFSEILAGGRKARGLSSFVISTMVTALVVVPMAWQARNVEDDVAPSVAAAAEQILVDTASEDVQPILDRTVDGNVLISFASENAAAVSFALAEEDGGPVVAERTDGVGPRFDLYTDQRGVAIPLDTRKLPDGGYQIFVTITNKDGSEQKTVAPFAVNNGGSS